MANINDYLNLISGEHRDQPRFKQVISFLINPLVETINVAQSLPQAFDVDTAIGAQLDVIGRWVGASRYVPTDVVGIYFTWNDVTPPTPSVLGWGKGFWNDPKSFIQRPTYLPDPIYRAYIYARIADNSFLGSLPQAYQVLLKIYGAGNVSLVDNQNFTMVMNISNTINPLIKVLVLGGYLQVKPVGVNLTINFV